MNIWFSSDLHFGHDRDFIYKPRGFENIEDMNKEIIKRWNSKVKEDDICYILGDLIMGSIDNISYLKRLNGKIHIIIGNHDTDNRIAAYKQCENVAEVIGLAAVIKIHKWRVYLSHYPTIVNNGEKEFNKACTLNFYGHTHQKTNFYNNNRLCYHVGLDSHDCYPVSFDEIISKMKEYKGE